MSHPCFRLKPEELPGRLKAPPEFDVFGSGVDAAPPGTLENSKALFLKDFSGDNSVSLEDSVLGVKAQASGRVHLELHGVNLVRRVLTVAHGETLRLSYKSRGSRSVVEDTIFMGKGAHLEYDGRFKVPSGEFSSTVRVVHSQPEAVSEVNIRGLVRGRATVLPTGEFLAGSRGSTTSINGSVVLLGKGKANAVPRLLIGDPATNAYHSFKKLQMTPEQAFYISSRGLTENNIEVLYERLILGG